jgi:D-sedoheptulose 7-phosphate isomerase
MLQLRTTLLNKVMNEAICSDRSGHIYTPDQMLRNLIDLFIEKRAKQKAVYIIGNGGSAGIASHFAVDLLNVMKVSAHTLYDTNQLTCIANDYGYQKGFKMQLAAHLRREDLLVAISSSGQSPNIVEAANEALEKKAQVVTLSGFQENNPLRQMGDYNIWVNAKDYGLVEMAHFCLLHTIVDIYQATQRKQAMASKN